MARKGYATATIHDATDALIVTLAEKYDRSKAWVIEEAVKFYIQYHEGGKPHTD